jgi:mannose-6-phosphate isomerase-like protein (cupin superfamily)
VSLRSGEIFAVPQGTEHKPSSPGDSVLMFEPFGTLMAGDGHHDGIPVSIDSTAGLDISE